jgi:SDR family mycofactocin-dependent oxidoreductase
MKRFKGKVAFITGAAHGQGRAAAVAFAREGASVAGFDLARPLPYPGYAMGSPEELDGLRAECEALGVACLTFEGDVRDAAAVAAAVEATVARLGAVDVLFNNAGICAYGLTHELSEEEWDAVVGVNLKGAWIVGSKVIPHMIQRRSGVIVNNCSVAGVRGLGRLSHYTASKFGVMGLTKAWAIELAPHGVRVVAVCPTGVNTPMNDGLAALEGATPEEIGERSAGNLLPVPWIEPEDVAEAVLFLASDGARYVTGSPLLVDAGLLTR